MGAPGRLGSIDPRPGYHTATALWPLGLCAVVSDEEAGMLCSEIVEGSVGCPAFRVTLDPPEGEPVVRPPVPPLRQPCSVSVHFNCFKPLQPACM